MFLLPDSGIDLDESDNRTWNASLDGRAVHSFLLWIEPANIRAGGARPAVRLPRHDELAGERGATPLGRGLLGLAALADEYPSILVPDTFEWFASVLAVVDGPEIAVLEDSPTGLRAAEPHRVRVVGGALDVLHRVRLRYVVDLALGVVAYAAHPPMARVRYTAWVTEPAPTALDLAETLIRAAARAWIDQWLRAEEVTGVRTEPIRADDEEWLSHILGECLVYQLFDRLAAGADTESPVWADRARSIHRGLSALRGELAERLGASTGFSVVSELVAFMYPAWNRRQFATKSPFDYMRSMRSFSADEKTEHRERWTDIGAVR